MATRGAALVAAAMVAASAVGAVVLTSTDATGQPATSTDAAAFTPVPPALAQPPAAASAPKTTLHLPTTLHLLNTTTGAAKLDSSHVVFAAGLTHYNSKRILATAAYTCVATASGTVQQRCTGAFAFRDGIILVSQTLDIATAKITGKVIGGSGAYKGARGSLSGHSLGGGKNRLTIQYSLG